MAKAGIFSLAAVLAVFLLFPAAVLGQPVPPHASKLVVTVDGEPASDRTEVTAWMDGELVASGLTTDGYVVIHIEGSAGLNGKPIHFKIDGIDAPEQDTWEQGGHVNKSFAISLSTSAGIAVVSTAWIGLNQYLVGKDGMPFTPTPGTPPQRDVPTGQRMLQRRLSPGAPPTVDHRRPHPGRAVGFGQQPRSGNARLVREGRRKRSPGHLQWQAVVPLPWRLPTGRGRGDSSANGTPSLPWAA